MKKIVFTKQGFEKTQKEYDQWSQQRPDAVKELQRARELGDLSENGLYKSARAKLSQIDRELRRLKYLLKNAEIVGSTTNGTIQIGSTVTLSYSDSQEQYTIVGDTEADPLNGKISSHSPIGRELIGKKAGDVIIVITPKSKVTYSIKSVS